MADMSIDVGTGVELKPRDTVVLVSDGVTDNLHLDELVELTRKGPLGEAVDSVVETVSERMEKEKPGQPSKPDDLSLIVFRKP